MTIACLAGAVAALVVLLPIVVFVHEAGHARVAESSTVGEVEIEIGKHPTHAAGVRWQGILRHFGGLRWTVVYTRWFVVGGYCAHDVVDDRACLLKLYNAGVRATARWTIRLAPLAAIAAGILAFASPGGYVAAACGFVIGAAFAFTQDAVVNRLPLHAAWLGLNEGTDGYVLKALGRDPSFRPHGTLTAGDLQARRARR